VARRCALEFNLTLSPTPVEIDTFMIWVLWHARHDQDPGHVWLRDAIRSIVRAQMVGIVDGPE
jgi:LysR family transcriptional regulator, mexEF-oprN operon transcriptional activator